jgi:DNA-binding SARP family transcriptional activator
MVSKMAHLSIRLLGPPQIALDENSITDFGSDKVRALLFYLASEPDQPHRRETLAGLLWPDYPERSARASLRSALADLRKAIGDRQTEPPFLHISRQAIQLNTDSDAWCDAVAFASTPESVPASQAMSLQLAQKLAQAVALYRGDFLTGFSIGDSAIFDEWATLKREQLRRQASASLQRLTAYHEANKAYETALTYAWRQLDLEPWQEEGHRQVMRLLALNGQRGAALAQYETCRHTLAEELNLEPAPETSALYEQIRDGNLPVLPLPEPTSPGAPEPSTPSTSIASKPDRPAIVKRLALIGSGLLLLAIITSAALAFAFNGKQNKVTSPTLPVSAAVEIEGGKLIDLCKGVTPLQICVIDDRTHRARSITAGLDLEEIGPGISWAPDGEQIAFAAGPDPAQTGVLEYNIYTFDTIGSDPHQITSGDTHDDGPAWSPDGQWIAFIRDGTLWLVRPDGSEAQHLWGKPGEAHLAGIAWSIDSQHIAFLNVPFPMTVSAELELWTINHDGSEPKIIHTLEQRILGGAVAWSPDSKQIACLCAFDDGERPLLFDVEGNSEPQIITQVPSSWFHNFWPQWGSIDGE